MNESLAIETRGLTKIYGSGNTEVVAMHDAPMAFAAARSSLCWAPAGRENRPFSPPWG